MVFQPLLMPTFLFGILFTLSPSLMGGLPPEQRWWLTLAIFLLTFGIPVASLGIFKLSGWISDITLSKRSERPLPFLFIVIFYGITTYYLGAYLRPLVLLVNMVYLTMGLLVVSVVVTFYWKISIHSAGMGAATGFLWVLDYIYPGTGLYLPMLLSVLCTGATMSARLHLRVHTMAQVCAGVTLGLMVSIVGMLLLT